MLSMNDSHLAFEPEHKDALQSGSSPWQASLTRNLLDPIERARLCNHFCMLQPRPTSRTKGPFLAAFARKA